MVSYFGKYEKFKTTSKDDAAVLLGRDNCVGDIYEIQTEFSEGVHRAWLVSRFDQKIGYFDEKTSRKISLLLADNLKVKGILTLVAFTEDENNGYYWGEAAIIGYNPAYDTEYTKFINNLSEKIAEGVCPKISLGVEGEAKIINNGGDWLPTQNMPTRKKTQGSAVLKDHRTLSDKMVEEGRKGNKGCYIVSWLFLLALVAAVVYVIMSLF